MVTFAAREYGTVCLAIRGQHGVLTYRRGLGEVRFDLARQAEKNHADTYRWVAGTYVEHDGGDAVFFERPLHDGDRLPSDIERGVTALMHELYHPRRPASPSAPHALTHPLVPRSRTATAPRWPARPTPVHTVSSETIQ